eukprot:995126-Pleurochrysis_carterae.AAC.2
MISDWGTPLTVRRQVKTHGSEWDCSNPHEISHGNRDRCQRRPACAMPQVVGDNKRLRRVQVRLGGRPRRNPICAWRGFVAQPGMRACAVMWPASWHRKFARNLLQAPARSPEHRVWP